MKINDASVTRGKAQWADFVLHCYAFLTSMLKSVDRSTFTDDTGKIVHFFLNTGCRWSGECTRDRNDDVPLLENTYHGTDEKCNIKMTNSLV